MRSFEGTKATSSPDPLHHTAVPVQTNTEEILPTPPGFHWTAAEKIHLYERLIKEQGLQFIFEVQNNINFVEVWKMAKVLF